MKRISFWFAKLIFLYVFRRDSSILATFLLDCIETINHPGLSFNTFDSVGISNKHNMWNYIFDGMSVDICSFDIRPMSNRHLNSHFDTGLISYRVFYLAACVVLLPVVFGHPNIGPFPQIWFQI